MRKPTRIAETALYVDDLQRATDFYVALFGCAVLRQDDRLSALRIAPEEVLLLFRRGASVQPSVLAGGGFIPSHDGVGGLHVCFGMEADQVEDWEQHLQHLAIPIESRVRWPGGAVSLYFRDPDGNAVELATPGLWSS
jgi:catechol 2,3-dioxygenase-like lactoylglutathione lyase family enzyme